MPTVPDNGRRLPKKLLRAVGARLLGRDAAAPESEAPFEVPLEFVAPGPVRKRTLYEIDGENFSTLDEFYGEIERVFAPDLPVRDLDDFNAMLYGDYVFLPHEGFTLRWKNHESSRQRLGYPETVRRLELRLQRCHPSNRRGVKRKLRAARKQKGPTVFDWLVEIVRKHGPGGEHEEDNVTLELA